jgi:hypothetical protein
LTRHEGQGIRAEISRRARLAHGRRAGTSISRIGLAVGTPVTGHVIRVITLLRKVGHPISAEDWVTSLPWLTASPTVFDLAIDATTTIAGQIVAVVARLAAKAHILLDGVQVAVATCDFATWLSFRADLEPASATTAIKRL